MLGKCFTMELHFQPPNLCVLRDTLSPQVFCSLYQTVLGYRTAKDVYVEGEQHSHRL
jgi:hypothetical protein